MPKATANATDEALSNSSRAPTRRSIVAGLAAMLPAAATAQAATPASANADAELISLAAQIAELQPEVDKAEAERTHREQVYQLMRPTMPHALLWCGNDGELVGRGGETGFMNEYGVMRYWCNLNQVERLRGRTSFAKWQFKGRGS